MSGPAFDRHDQLDTVAANLLEEERIVAVFDAVGPGVGFLGLTTLRVVLEDTAFPGTRTALTSIPYPRIGTVSFVADRGGRTAGAPTVALTVGERTWEVVLRDAERARFAHDVVLEHLARP